MVAGGMIALSSVQPGGPIEVGCLRIYDTVFSLLIGRWLRAGAINHVIRFEGERHSPLDLYNAIATAAIQY